ncbi:MAG: hypothetical protein HS111_21670 [Kofleriaceae bacterium]|nr:hypothetical protein [Kofleriaceae bacterium]
MVYIDFRPSYVESLRLFGLRAVDQAIRARVLESVQVAAHAPRGVNLELRTAPPTDFALFSLVESHGPAINGQGLFGYDNSPGKDTGNLRLHDRLGGVNARPSRTATPATAASSSSRSWASRCTRRRGGRWAAPSRCSIRSSIRSAPIAGRSS